MAAKGPRDYTLKEIEEWHRLMVPPGPIVRCEECGADITPYQRGKIQWCPYCHRNHI
jgi:hypothetical protein